MKEIVTSRAVIMTETNDSSRYRECFNCSWDPSGKNTTKNKPDSFCLIVPRMQLLVLLSYLRMTH